MLSHACQIAMAKADFFQYRSNVSFLGVQTDSDQVGQAPTRQFDQGDPPSQIAQEYRVVA